MPDRFSSINWDDLRVFLAVAREGSLRGAARALAVNHATVTRRLGTLESGLNTRLFDRLPEGFKPTQAGEDLLGTAERMEDEMAAAERQVAGRDADPAGLLRLSLPPALMQSFLAPELVAFTEAYPKIDIAIDCTDSFLDLTRREADVSIRMTHEVTDDVVGRRLIRYAKAIYAAPSYLKARKKKDWRWIGWDEEEKSPGWVKQTPFPDCPVRHRLFGHLPQREAAKAGLGLTMLPCFVGDMEPGLARVPRSAPTMDRSLWILLHGDLRKTARVRALVDFMAEAILKHRPLLEGRTPRG